MFRNIVTTLKRSIGLGRTEAPGEMDVDQFVEQLQDLLMSAPYSREVRDLGRFARKQPNPEYRKVYERKRALFDQFRRENRPPGLMSWLMYLAERYAPQTRQPSLLRDAMLTLGMVFLVVLGIEYAKTWLNRANLNQIAAPQRTISEYPYTFRIDTNGNAQHHEALDRSTFDRWLATKVNAALDEVKLEQIISEKLHAGLSQEQTANLLEDRLREAVAKADLDALISHQVSQSLETRGLDQRLADSLAGPELEQRVLKIVEDSLTSDVFAEKLKAALTSAVETKPAAEVGGP